MNVDELVVKKEKVEDEISEFVKEKAQSLITQTGLRIRGIQIVLTDLGELTGSAEFLLISTDIVLDI